MEEIESLKNKHLSATVPQLEELINKYGKHIQKVKEEETEMIKESEVKLEKLASKVTAMKESLQTERQVLEQKNKELLQYNESIVKLKAEHDKFVQESRNLEIQKNILKTTKPNQQDQLLLEQGKAKLHLYKELTGIHWDYSTLKENIKGYVSNKRDYIHHFCFTQNEEDPKEVPDRLWNEIYLSVENTLTKNSTEDSVVNN